ncbi:hypothetical protein EK904_012901 [Melospiza melodia maxima]|nr:hypothetical protein EK904_012901 [Melospiza melodia maxima]
MDPKNRTTNICCSRESAREKPRLPSLCYFNFPVAQSIDGIILFTLEIQHFGIQLSLYAGKKPTTTQKETQTIISHLYQDKEVDLKNTKKKGTEGSLGFGRQGADCGSVNSAPIMTELLAELLQVKMKYEKQRKQIKNSKQLHMNRNKTATHTIASKAKEILQCAYFWKREIKYSKMLHYDSDEEKTEAAEAVVAGFICVFISFLMNKREETINMEKELLSLRPHERDPITNLNQPMFCCSHFVSHQNDVYKKDLSGTAKSEISSGKEEEGGRKKRREERKKREEKKCCCKKSDFCCISKTALDLAYEFFSSVIT